MTLYKVVIRSNGATFKDGLDSDSAMTFKMDNLSGIRLKNGQERQVFDIVAYEAVDCNKKLSESEFRASLNPAQRNDIFLGKRFVKFNESIGWHLASNGRISSNEEIHYSHQAQLAKFNFNSEINFKEGCIYRANEVPNYCIEFFKLCENNTFLCLKSFQIKIKVKFDI